MTAGVPGSGIGGFFYVLSALFMPVQECVSICKKKSSRSSRRMVVRQVLNASGVLCGVWLTGWFIRQAFCTVTASIESHNPNAISQMRWFNPQYGLVTLLSVFLFIQVLSATLRIVRPHIKHHSKAKLPA